MHAINISIIKNAWNINVEIETNLNYVKQSCFKNKTKNNIKTKQKYVWSGFVEETSIAQDDSYK